jgi:hypothetical protein
MAQEIEKEAVASSGSSSDPASDLVWGAEAIGKEINRTARQTLHLYEIGALDGIVVKLGHRTIAASRRKLHALASRKAK